MATLATNGPLFFIGVYQLTNRMEKKNIVPFKDLLTVLVKRDNNLTVVKPMQIFGNQNS